MSDGSARSCVMLVGVGTWVAMSAGAEGMEQGMPACCSAVVLLPWAKGNSTYPVTGRMQRDAIDDDDW